MCTVTALWLGPENAEDAQVTGYNVYVNGTLTATNGTVNISTNNETRISTIFSVPDCAAHMVSVRAINKCNKEGKSSSILTLDPEQLLLVPGGMCNGAVRNDKCK